LRTAASAFCAGAEAGAAPAAGARSRSRSLNRASASVLATGFDGLTTEKTPSMRDSSLRNFISTAMPAELMNAMPAQSSRTRWCPALTASESARSR
jgi:hypothetical protein